jgi:hypothetical protein
MSRCNAASRYAERPPPFRPGEITGRGAHADTIIAQPRHHATMRNHFPKNGALPPPREYMSSDLPFFTPVSNAVILAR